MIYNKIYISTRQSMIINTRANRFCLHCKHTHTRILSVQCVLGKYISGERKVGEEFLKFARVSCPVALSRSRQEVT